MQQFLSQMEKLTQQQQQLNDMMNGMGQGGAQAQELRQQAQLQKMAAQQQLAKLRMYKFQRSEAVLRIKIDQLRRVVPRSRGSASSFPLNS